MKYIVDEDHTRPSKNPDIKRHIKQSFGRFAWNYAQSMYQYKINDREKVLKLNQVVDTLTGEDFTLNELMQGFEQACKEFTEEGYYYIPPAIKIREAVMRIYNKDFNKQEDDTDYKVASIETKRRETFQKDFYNQLGQEKGDAIVYKFLQEVSINADNPFYKYLFFADFFCQDSVAKSILKDYGIEIRKRSGEVYS